MIASAPGRRLLPRRARVTEVDLDVEGGCPCLVVKPLGVGFLGFRVGSGVVGRGFGF